MKKTMLLALSLLMGINAWSYENVDATFKWTVGNEAAAIVTSDAADGVGETKVKVGAGLTVVGTVDNYAANNGNTMVQYKPATSKAGVDAAVMIEYRVKMKKGITFQLTSISYDAIKDGTDDASYSWSYAVDGAASDTTAVAAADLLRNSNTSGTPALNHSHAITAAAGREIAFRIYVSGFANNKKFALSNIVLTGTINGEEEVRSFTDFKVDFRSNPYILVAPATLPANVELTNINYHSDLQHGLNGGTIKVTVDGPVKFTIGGCSWGNGIAIQKNGEALTAIDNKVGCDNSGVGNGYTKFVTWTYNVEEAAELSFTVNGYLPYFFAEACEFIPQVEVRYYDVDGQTIIGKETVNGGSELAYKYGAADVTVAEGKAFRGWFNSTGVTATKVAEGLGLTEDLNLYAKATDIEVTALGKIFDYDFRQPYFYPEDHEMLSLNGGKYKDAQHGWVFSNGNSLSVQVAGNALLAVDVCTYSETGYVKVTDADNDSIGALIVEKQVTGDGAKQTIYYEGDATTLTFHFTATNYIHHIKVYNLAALPTKDEELGYYILTPGDGAGLKLVLEALQEGDKIFLPNGVYDFGEDVLTQISKSNVSIIGQSMDSVIIRNAPDFHNEGIGTTATILIPKNVTNTYFQDLTIQNALDYYGAIAAGLKAARAVCLQDQGTKTICKNVKMLSYQDTYYSNLSGAVKYFEDCEIHGTVDFICGDGSVYFKNNLLYAEKRNADGSGSDALTANNGPATDRGYVFESCTIQSESPVISLGRAWNNTPKCVFLNTLVDSTAGNFKFADSKGEIQRWTKELMSESTGWPVFGEYNTHTEDGTVISPESNKVTFKQKVPKTGTQELETILTADSAATFTMDYTLGTWATTAAADATQAVCEEQWADLEADAIYLAEADGEFVMLLKGSEVMNTLALYNGVEYTLRKANARGGFGLKAGEEPQGVDNVAEEAVRAIKRIENGQVIILRDGKKFSILGVEL